MMKCILLLMLIQVSWIIEGTLITTEIPATTGLKVISIIKRLIKKKRGECVTLEGEHYFQTNDTFVWKKRETTTMVSGDRIRISGDRGKTVEIRRLEESDTAMYSAMIHTAGGLEITRHWLVVRGCDVNEKEIDFNGCQTACEAMCLKGWHHFGDKCYRYFSQPRTWLNAYYYCQGQFGAKLATIDSREENDFVGHLLMTGSGGWLGLNDRSKESRFLWNYNKFDQPAYFAWDKGDGKNPEPNNFNGQCNVENCVEMNSVNKKWNDVVCKAHRSYVCERTFAEDLPGWTCVDDNCYLYVREAVTWDWARKTCIEKNATLVTISSTSKNNLIGRLIKTNIWIGLNDRVEAGIYVWNDIGQGQLDNKPSYLNWDKEEPNDKHYDRFTPQRCDGEDCVQINIWNGVVTWFDLNCDIALPFICEKSRDPYLSFAAWIAISMGAGLILSVFGGRAYMEFKHRKGRKELKQMIVEATENEERKDL